MATMSARYTVIDGEVVAQERSGVRHQLVPDPLGSTVALYDNAETKTDTFGYWPYGEIAARTGSTTIKFQYIGSVGYVKDNVNYYVRYRYLNSFSARWITEDPLYTSSGGINLFWYVDSSPVTHSDRSGLDKECPKFPNRACWACYYLRGIRSGGDPSLVCAAAAAKCGLAGKNWSEIDCKTNPVPPAPPAPPRRPGIPGRPPGPPPDWWPPLDNGDYTMKECMAACRATGTNRLSCRALCYVVGKLGCKEWGDVCLTKFKDKRMIEVCESVHQAVCGPGDTAGKTCP